MISRRIISLLIGFLTLTVLVFALSSTTLLDRGPTAALMGAPRYAVDSSGRVVDQLLLASDANLTEMDTQNRAVQDLDQRIVIKNASLQIVANDVAAAINSITQLAETMGGWVISSSTSKTTRSVGDEVITGSIAIRVPADQLNTALTQIKAQAASVDSESVTGTDVTQEYTDLNSQVTNLQAAERQLQILLEAAQSTDSVLQIYNELVRVRGEIEIAQGRINYYNEASSYSSISVTLRPPNVAQAAVQVDTAWSPATTVSGAFNALVNILQGLANFLIIVVVLVIPVLLVIGIPLWLLYKLWQRFDWVNRRPTPITPPSNTQVENDVG